MASWTLPYRVEAVDRDPGFYWQDLDDTSNDMSNEFFGQFINFDSEVPSSLTGPHSGDPTLPVLPDSLLLDPPAESTASSGVSTIEDDFDFLSSSSQAGAPMSVASAPHEIDPQQLTLGGEDLKAPPQVHSIPRASMSDPELPRNLDRISLHSSPTKHVPASQPPSPTPPNTTARKPNKFVEALSSTIRKANKLRRPSRKPMIAMDRPGSPTMDHPPRALRLQTHDFAPGPEPYSASPPRKHDPAFIHGYCEDPFNEVPQQPPPHLRFFSHNGLHTPADSPVVKPEPGPYPPEMVNQVPPANWAQHPVVAPMPDQHWPGHEYVAHPDGGWWDLNILHQQNGEYMEQQKNAHINMAMHAQHAELPYEYQHVHDPSAAGLMIHMPQPRPGQPHPANEIAVNGQTYLPPPPPIPPTERQHRPPRAPSSGARHLSCSPIRKTRAPSASPTTAHSRHSSGGSVASSRSASGRGLVPGTPTTMRKQRRSRESSGGEIGFVNFTPNDGGLLMTGVAPSGSSKTKARREREALERRRRLSEAAMKAVQAAGGDVDKLREQGFAL